MRKIIHTYQKPSPELLTMIEVANLIPFDAEPPMRCLPMFDKSDDLLNQNPKAFVEMLFREWAEYPLLMDYLIAKREERNKLVGEEEDVNNPSIFYATGIVCDFESFMKTRNLFKLLLEIAEEYRKHLEDIRLICLGFESSTEANIEEAKQLGILDTGIKDFEKGRTLMLKYLNLPFTLHSHFRGIFQIPSEHHRTLAKRFFESVIDTAILTTNENHTIKIKLDGLMSEIQDLDLRRFMQCAECQKIIWASRLDAKFCSRKCSNLHWQKEYMSDDEKREQYNQQRRNRYQSKKELK